MNSGPGPLSAFTSGTTTTAGRAAISPAHTCCVATPNSPTRPQSDAAIASNDRRRTIHSESSSAASRQATAASSAASRRESLWNASSSARANGPGSASTLSTR